MFDFEVFLKLMDAEIKKIEFEHQDPQNLQQILRREMNNRDNIQEEIEHATKAFQIATKDNTVSGNHPQSIPRAHEFFFQSLEEQEELRVVQLGFFRNALLHLRDKVEISVPHSRELIGVLDPTKKLPPQSVIKPNFTLMLNLSFLGFC